MVNHFHVLDFPVTFNATDPTVHVNGVVEVNVIRSLMNPDPRHGFTTVITVADDLQQWRIFLHHAVATHTHIGAGDVRVARAVHKGMAITAINFQLT